jgi:hypothetical protein
MLFVEFQFNKIALICVILVQKRLLRQPPYVDFKNNSAQKPQKKKMKELYIACIFEGTKAKFLFNKDFCVTFVLWNIPIFGIMVSSFD